MADTTKTVKSSGGDYTTLSGALAGVTSPINVGDRWIIECDALADTTTVTCPAITVNGDLIIRNAAGQRHDGTIGTGYRLNGSSSSYASYFGSINHLTLEGLAIRNTNTGTSSGSYGLILDGCENSLVKDCLITRAHATETEQVVDVYGSSTEFKFINTVIIGGSALKFGHGSGTPVATVYNCTLIGHLLYGINIRYLSAINMKNCYVHGATTCYNGPLSGTLTCTTCQHSNSESVTGSTGSKAYSTTQFTSVTANSENLSLPGGSSLIDAGTDLSGDGTYAFSTDILAATRSGTWEIGAFNYAAAGGGLPFFMQSDLMNGGTQSLAGGFQ